MNEHDNLRKRINDMKWSDLKHVAIGLIDGFEAGDMTTVRKVLRMFDEKRLPSQRRTLKEEMSLAEQIANAYDGRLLSSRWSDIIEITLSKPRSSREIMMGLSIRYPQDMLTPEEGIHQTNQRMLKKILVLAGFMSSHVYDSTEKKTKRVWIKMPSVEHLTDEQIKENYRSLISKAEALLNSPDESTDKTFGDLI